ncbi:MAG: MFS transporter [Bacillota bacterium]|nr:MFS transporter [Bacillota bacterium]
MNENRSSSALEALRYPNFRYLWFGLLVANTGAWMQIVAQGWLIYDLTGSALYLGSVGLARAIPMLTLSLVGGAVSDRMDRRRLLYVTNILTGCLAFLLGLDIHLGTVQPWHVLLIAFLSSSVLAFDQPTRQALVPSLVPRSVLLNAIALNSITFNGAAVLGPSLAGLLVPLIGLEGNFFINSVGYLAVIYALYRMKLPPYRSRTSEGARPSVLDDIRQGLSYVTRHKVLLALVLSGAGLSFFARSSIVLFPIFAGDVLQAGVKGLGYLMSANGVGTVLGGIILANLKDFRHKGLLVVTAIILQAILLALFGMSTQLWSSLALLTGFGAASILAASTINTLLQLSTGEAMRGRVMSLFTLSMLGMTPLGQMPLGTLADALGPGYAVMVGALCSLGVLLLALSIEPGLRKVP